MARSALVPIDSGKREAILDAALALFAERGFHGTAVPLVAERAGVGAGTVYRYFTSKESLVNALFQHWKGELGRVLFASVPPDAPPRKQFHALWQSFAGFARAQPLVLDFLELHHHGGYLDAASRKVEAAMLGPLHAYVLHAQAQHALRAGPPELLIALVYGAMIGLIRAERAGYLELSDAVVDAAEVAIWNAVRE